MERLIWECQVCGHDVMPESIVLEGDEWSSDAVAVYPDGKRIDGKFNILGMLGEESLFDGKGDMPAVYHSFCYRNSTRPEKFPGASKSSPMSDHAGFFRMVKDLGRRRKEVYERVLRNLTSAGEEVDSKFYKINGHGDAVVSFPVIEELSHTISGGEYVLSHRVILHIQSQIAKVWADDMRETGAQAKKFQPEIQSHFEKAANLYDRIADVLEKASAEIDIIKADINGLAMAVNSMPKPKMDVANFRSGVAKDIAEKGWVVMAISEEIPFAYTIGLFRNFKHPEIVVTAIGQNQASELLNCLAQRVAKGEKFEVGRIYESDDEMLRSVYVKVENKHYRSHFGTAQDYYNALYFPVIQRVTADKEGRFPWDEGCDPVLKAAQKILGKAKITK